MKTLAIFFFKKERNGNEKNKNMPKKMHNMC